MKVIKPLNVCAISHKQILLYMSVGDMSNEEMGAILGLSDNRRSMVRERTHNHSRVFRDVLERTCILLNSKV